MFPRPMAIGLAVCENTIVARESGKVTLVNQFRTLRFSHFPALAPPFWVAALLTGTTGSGMIRFEVVDLETLNTVHSFERQAQFLDRFWELQVLFRITRCQFFAPGWFDFRLLVDSEIIASRRVHVLARS